MDMAAHAPPAANGADAGGSARRRGVVTAMIAARAGAAIHALENGLL